MLNSTNLSSRVDSSTLQRSHEVATQACRSHEQARDGPLDMVRYATATVLDTGQEWKSKEFQGARIEVPTEVHFKHQVFEISHVE